MNHKAEENPMSDPIVEAVRSKYASVAQSGLSGEHAGVQGVAEAFGYSREQLASIPAEANMGLSCGNPTAFASLRSGEVVVDLGCGGGLDVFLAAAKVGPSGKAIGIDMTPEMIARAEANAAKGSGGKPITNVEFHLATIDRLPLPDASADCVISNCVINLAPDKPAVFREIARVLKPGGRLAVSDLVLKKPLPPEIAADVMAYVGCIAGAISVDDYRRGLLEAGFAEVRRGGHRGGPECLRSSGELVRMLLCPRLVRMLFRPCLGHDPGPRAVIRERSFGRPPPRIRRICIGGSEICCRDTTSTSTPPVRGFSR